MVRTLAIILLNAGISGALTIMSYGGSVTWGSQLQTDDLAWPVLLGQKYESAGHKHVRIYNYAMRAKGSFEPGLCLLDILRDAPPDTFNTGHRLVNNQSLAGPPDVIVLEYSINGIGAIELLIMKLRLLYPQAQLVFLSLFSLQAEIRVCTETEGFMARKGPKVKNETAGPFCWHKRKGLFKAGVEESWRNRVQTVTYPYKTNPMDHVADFAGDWHHINAKGHAIAASLLYDALSTQDKHVLHRHISSSLSANWGKRLADAGYPYTPDNPERGILEGCWRYNGANPAPGWVCDKADPERGVRLMAGSGNCGHISFATAGLSKSKAIAISRFNTTLPATFNGASMYLEYKTAADKPDYGFVRIATNAMSIEIDTKAMPGYKHHAFQKKYIGTLNCSSVHHVNCTVAISAHGRTVVRLAGFYLNPYHRLFPFL